MFARNITRRNFAVKLFNREGKGYEIRDKLLINGQWVPSKSGKTFDLLNPATEELISPIAAAQKEDVDEAVEAAKVALKEWKKCSGAQRAMLMNKFADSIDAHADELITLECEDMGKTYEEACFDMAFCSATIRYYAGMASNISGTSLQRDVGPFAGASYATGYGYTRKEPIGIAGLITPWNFPALMTMWKVAPCLASGSVGICKPPELAPLSSMRLVELWNQVDGVIPGVLQSLPGIGAEVGEAIVDHPDIRKVAFTGSGEIGKRIMSRASANLKRVTLELGGKGPFIVFADADLDKAVDLAASMGYLNSGQFCAAPTRLIVEEPVHDQFVERVAQKARDFKLGYWKEQGITRGPIVSEKQMNRILNYIEIGKKEGAEIVAGGVRADRKGFFVEPTLFAGCNNDMRSVREEIFGPVLSVLKFNGIDEALEIANNSSYGLTGSVQTTDMRKADIIAREMQQGNVNVNSHFSVWVDSPFGGFKESGIGRELGTSSLDNYLETKSVLVQTE